MENQNEEARAILLNSRKGEIRYVFVSPEDFEYLIKFNWHLSGRYARNKKIGFMHRAIAKRMDLDLTDKEIDHRDRNPLNNLRSNLRAATHKENMKNQSIRSNNSSGIPGVSFHKRANRWQAHIMISGKEKHLGYFKTFEEAKEARIAAEIEHYGEFAPIH